MFKYNDNKIKYLILIIFAVSTFIIMLCHEPFRDEVNAWLIAKYFNFRELLQIEKYDGHLFIWHTMLMPFAKNNFLYPLSMKILNWIFALLSVVILWNFAPFSKVEKTLITFSYPFFIYFSTVARCYSVGIFLLFIILSLWKKRLNHPLLFSFLIILSANTSVMILVASISLGLIYLYDLIKNKKPLFYPILIFIIGGALIFYQIGSAVNPNQELVNLVFIKRIKNFLFQGKVQNLSLRITNVIFALSAFSALFGAFFAFLKRKRALFFLTLSYLLLFYIFSFKYYGHWWHYLFFFVFLIAAVWIQREENSYNGILNGKSLSFFDISFIFLLTMFTIKAFIFPFDYWEFVYEERNSDTYKIVKNLIEPNDKIYFFNADFIGLMPYLNYNMYDKFGDKRYSVNGYKRNMSPIEPDVDTFANTLSNKGRNIVFLKEIPNDLYGNKYVVKFDKIYSDETPIYMFLITKEDKESDIKEKFSDDTEEKTVNPKN